jgi:hypothetical protein
MARHAGLGGWNPGKGRRFDAAVTMAAVETETADMMLMAEWRWLGDRYVFAGLVRRQRQCVRKRHEREGRNGERADRAARDAVGARSKDLRHLP